MNTVSFEYQREPDLGDGLRLHLNENTCGCSPAVVAALRALDATTIARYPDYRAVTTACATYLGVQEERVLLTNGLDEGLLAAAIACLRRTSHAEPEAIIIEPAFGMYADCIEALAGRLVTVSPRPSFAFPLEETLRVITPATRLLFVTSPGNPTGTLVPREDIRRLAAAVPDGALVFVDEAYAEFTSEHFVSELDTHPNVVVGRTFAKAQGLAGLRIGAVIGLPAPIERLRRALPPYSINVAAAVALEAALADRDALDQYRREVAASRQLVYTACERLGLGTWPSHANFVLVRVGDRASAIVERLRTRGVFVRDRSSQPGCAGCIRITTGLVDHTDACLRALEEELCAAG